MNKRGPKNGINAAEFKQIKELLKTKGTTAVAKDTGRSYVTVAKVKRVKTFKQYVALNNSYRAAHVEHVKKQKAAEPKVELVTIPAAELEELKLDRDLGQIQIKALTDANESLLATNNDLNIALTVARNRADRSPIARIFKAFKREA